MKTCPRVWGRLARAATTSLNFGQWGWPPGPPITRFATASLSKLKWWRSIRYTSDRRCMPVGSCCALNWMTSFRRTGYHCPLTTRLGVRGASQAPQLGPGLKMEFMHIWGCYRKKLYGTPFSVFLNDGGAPKHRGARENFPFLSTGLPVSET